MIIPIISSTRRNRYSRRSLRISRTRSHAAKVVLLPVAAAFMALSSCNDESTTKPTPLVSVTDTEPVGAGLSVIGFAILGAAVVVVLGRLLR